jgi:tetratricopeptide (TPR) repeat protein
MILFNLNIHEKETTTSYHPQLFVNTLNMKYLIILLAIISIKANAQIDLKFDKRFVECEDKWVVFKMNKDSSFLFGFIYIDEQAGLTFNSEGDFKINPDNSLRVKKIKDANIKVRLEPNNVKVALLPESTYKELQIEPPPDWLKYYKTDTASAKRLYKWGYMYNGWNECSKALSYLLQAKEIEPNYEGLNVELAFSYNCLKEYDKAEKILEEEIILKPTDAYVNKEYIFTISKTENIDKATKQYLKSKESIKDKTYHAENCYNILQFFYIKGDKSNFNFWYKELNKNKIEDNRIKEYADNMKKDLFK